MKKQLNNKKGFTLIELLAVIVILAILVMVAIPAVTKYLNSARQGTFADNAMSAISAVRNDVIMKGFIATNGDTMIYDKDEINGLLEKKLNSSPFGGEYSHVEIRVKQKTDADTNNATYEYDMCLIDRGGHGFGFTKENEISSEKVELSGQTECTTAS